MTSGRLRVGSISILALLDLSEAFDTINYGILLDLGSGRRCLLIILNSFFEATSSPGVRVRGQGEVLGVYFVGFYKAGFFPYSYLLFPYSYSTTT